VELHRQAVDGVNICKLLQERDTSARNLWRKGGKLEGASLVSVAGISHAFCSKAGRTYSLSRAHEAVSYFGAGHARGKVVITV
jgi:hypothetical protein